MASLYFQQQSSAIFYAVLGRNANANSYDYFGNQLENGTYTPELLVTILLSGTEGLGKYAGKTDTQILTQIYSNIYKATPDSDYIKSLLDTGDSVNTLAANMVTDLLYYDGFDSATLAAQNTFETQIDTALFYATSPAAKAGSAEVQAFHYLLGTTQSAESLNYWGTLIANGSKTPAEVAQSFANSSAPAKLYTDSQFVSLIYQNAYLRAPTAAETSYYVNKLATGTATRGDVMVEVINTLTNSATETAAKTQFINATHVYNIGELPALSHQEQVAALFLAVPHRDVDASGLDTWSKQLTYINETALATKLINSAEFQAKGANLTGDAFIQHVFTAVRGVPATASQLAAYNTLGTDKATITLAIINDLRTSTATDNTTLTQQHAFEADIGTSLLYKTTASLSSSASGGNAIGTVNTGFSHVLNNTETAVLQNVLLNADTASKVDLKYADQLANLTINGTAAATVNLSDNGANKGVNIVVNNANVNLNASSGADRVVLTNAAAVGNSVGQFNLGLGDDSLTWVGNATKGGFNTVSNSLRADGGAGSNTISANLITKNVNVTGSKATISTNATQFTNFDKIDLAGYIGKANVNFKSTAADHTFDFGALTGNATWETSAIIFSTVQAPKSNLGSQGFVLSGFADAVKVINAAGGSAAKLEITGDATKASSLDFNFLYNATNKFDINFTAHSDADVDAGSIGLSRSDLSNLFSTKLTTVNIASGGTGDFTNLLKLKEGGEVTTINVTGDHLLDLTIGSALSEVRTINASGNTGGVNITADIAGTGASSLAEFINKFPFGSVLTTVLGINGQSINITGTTVDDTFTVKGNTSITGNGGNDKFEIVSSSSTSSVKITDYNYASNSILDLNSNILVDTDTSGTKVANYGFKTAASITNPPTTNIGDLLASLLGLNSLSAKVGISSVDDTHFLVIDQNDNGKLDSADTVVTLVGGSHNALVNNLYYAEA
ncbi:TPA: DUF4214 domain-containing protein [Serratia marcescens]|uniref:DUF4214 domain-containing protein n=1 Tax=Serratia ureilytica TaxID=300181 RepID=UPI0018D77F15|nr:DUF4214 domain-containing protein [Serratia ureilytica]MBH3319146.1 DUF4214 domain-containing protein [Serratia ureilytica]